MIELQRKLMGDTIRNKAFADALKKVIKRGKTVLADIGAGTGFLSFLACKFGAKKCFLYESGDIIGTARALARRNGCRQCVFVQKHSTEVSAPVQADVVVCETLGNFATEENIIENMEDAKRFLKPGGVLMPGKLTQYVAPITNKRLLREIDIWDTVGFGLDFDEARTVALNNIYVKTITKADLMPGKDAVRVWDTIDFQKHNKTARRATTVWKLDASTEIFGFALWWEAELVPGITLSTSPFAPLTHWEQIVLPVLKPLQAGKGATISLTMKTDSSYETGVSLEWDILHTPQKGKTSKQSLNLAAGMLS